MTASSFTTFVTTHIASCEVHPISRLKPVATATTRIRYGQPPTYLRREPGRGVNMARNRLYLPGFWVQPERMAPPLSFPLATVTAEMSQQRLAFHSTTTTS